MTTEQRLQNVLTALCQMMATADYLAFLATEPTYDQCRDKRLELANAQKTETRGKNEAIRIDTGRLDFSRAGRR